MALALASLAAWAILSNCFSSQAAQSSSSACSAPSFLTANVVHRFPDTGDITTGDFNGDHHLDAVTLAGKDVAILPGDGTGNFGAPTFFFAAPDGFIQSLAVGDLNGDGKLDVVKAGVENGFSTDGDLSILLGDGAGGFGPARPLTTDGAFNEIALGDFDGDGKLDLAASSLNGVWVMQGDGTGSLGSAVQYQTAGSNLQGIEMADFNGDGKTDLVTANPNADKVAVLLNDGSGHFSTVREFATSKRPLDLLASDVNGDGKADVITTSSNAVEPSNISVLLGDGAGNLAPRIDTPTHGVHSISSGDFNGDGKLDLFTISSRPQGILLGDGTGHFGAPREFNLGSFSSRPEGVVGDFNEDGKLDVATNYMTISFGDGAGRLLAAPSFRVGNDPASVAAGDFNEDGKADLVVANSFSNDNNVSLLIGDGTGWYAPATSLGVGFQPRFVAVADFNGDYHLDFVTANSGVDFTRPEVPGTVSVRLGDGEGNFAPAVNFPSGFAPSSVVVRDFDRDGKLDLAVANPGFATGSESGSSTFAASVSILIGDGAGSFAAPHTLELPNLAHSIPLSVAAGDLNNDGKLDLVVAKSTTLSVLLGDGTGHFGTAIDHAAAKTLTSVVLGDFDRDGNLDVATANGFTNGQDSNTVSIRSGDGAGNLGAAHDFPVATNPVHIAAGDFNLDSNLDLVVANGGPASVTLGDGTGSFGAPTEFHVSAQSVTVADLNGDGKLDMTIIPSGVATHYITVLLNTCGGSVNPTPTPTPTVTPTPTPTVTPTPTPTPTPSSAPQLLTEEGTNHAIALESVTFTRGPFAVRTWLNFSPDQRTRIILFASNLQLLPGEDASLVTAQAEDAQHRVFPLVVEHVGKLPVFDWLAQVVVKLPDELEGAGDVQVSVSLRGVMSNKAFITIQTGTTDSAREWQVANAFQLSCLAVVGNTSTCGRVTNRWTNRGERLSQLGCFGLKAAPG